MKRNPYLPNDRAFARKEEGTNVEQEEAKEELTQQRAQTERIAGKKSIEDYIRGAEAGEDEETNDEEE